ncbi:DUF6508 domain-containing protein [Lacticaseibacillus mingshuiensis]|uniref:DUF6508 domain-containing protein n=1 Tax=Lacticaseibacillus mingshuiensis TaxID=2799574 RepID=A0ABW4CFP5_9LACO|nr:DUF6508 domain-containing protein [Lacticaseibacillus mingshuiensis]
MAYELLTQYASRFPAPAASAEEKTADADLRNALDQTEDDGGDILKALGQTQDDDGDILKALGQTQDDDGDIMKALSQTPEEAEPEIEINGRVRWTLDSFIHDFDTFALTHPEIADYSTTLTDAGLGFSRSALAKADVTEAGATVVLAMLVAISRLDRFSDGLLAEFAQDGHLHTWLTRLAEVDH